PDHLTGLVDPEGNGLFRARGIERCKCSSRIQKAMPLNVNVGPDNLASIVEAEGASIHRSGDVERRERVRSRVGGHWHSEDGTNHRDEAADENSPHGDPPLWPARGGTEKPGESLSGLWSLSRRSPRRARPNSNEVARFDPRRAKEREG